MACTSSTSESPKVVRTLSAFNIFTWKCASRHNGVHFFDISTSESGPTLRCFVHFDLEMCFAPQRRALFRHLKTSKSGPTLRCFVHFDLEMCFAPQRRALFRHLNFQKRSDHGVFCTFWLGNVLRTTTACNFSSLIWPAGSAPPTFRPSGATIHWKNTVFRDFPTFSRICIFFLLTLLIFSLLIFFFSDLLSSNLSLLSASSLLCFSSVHIVGRLTSKLPSIIAITSSTAQGSGGNLKNRKPIGEVGCMAERSHWWTERCLSSPLFLSLSLTIYLPTYLSMYLSSDRSLSLSLFHLITYLSISLSLSFSLSLSLSSVYLSSCLPVYLSIYLSVYLSTCLSVVQCHSV